MDGLFRYLNNQTNKDKKVTSLNKYLRDQAYDTDSLMEDLSGYNQDDAKNSMLFQNGQFDVTMIHLIQRYIYYQTCMLHIILLLLVCE